MSPTTMFNIYVMSYKRADKTKELTHSILEYCTYVVREEEEQDYLDAGISNLLLIPKNTVFDFMSTFYWILENTPETVVCIIDDDIKQMVYRIQDNDPIVDENGNPDKPAITSEIERIGQLIYDLSIGMAFESPQGALYGYGSEFSFKGMPGHIRWINKESFKATYDPNDAASSDIDMMCQELLMNRIVLLPKAIVVIANMDTMEGILENRSEHIGMVTAMKLKWGAYYNYDFKKNQAKINVER